MKKIITRKEYLAGVCTYAEYYAQFVNGHVLGVVSSAFGKEKLREAFALDKDFNSIPLKSWDQLAALAPIDQNIRKLTGDTSTLAGQICILKRSGKAINSRLS